MINSEEVNKKTIAYKKTKMTTFIKAQLQKSDDQTNNDKNRAAANITEYHIIQINDYRGSSLFKSYLTAKGIISESLISIGKF